MGNEAKLIWDASKLFDKLPPHSDEAELSVIGSMILDPRVIGEVLMIIDGSQDFYFETHAAIFRAIIDIWENHQNVDLVLLVDKLRSEGSLDDVGGPEYLLQAAEKVPSAINAPYYAKIVAARAKLRRLIDASMQAVFMAYHTDGGIESTSEVLDQAESAIFEIAQDDAKSDPQQLDELLLLELKRLEAAEGTLITGVPTGFEDLDELLSGLQPGEMIVLAARPSMGKTAFALNVAEQIAFGGCTPYTQRNKHMTIPVGVFSLEMTKSAVVQRLLSAYSDIDSHRLRTGAISNDEMEYVRKKAGELSKAPIFVDDTPAMTILTLRARARRMVAQYHVKVIMVDYLQLLTAPAVARESRQVEVSAISRGIKALARELNIPVVCLSQLNRGAESREGNRPRMSDLRESGSIEQDADVVMLLHRESYYHRGEHAWDPAHHDFDEGNRDRLNTAELIIAKQRNGPTGLIRLTWDDKTTRFKNYTPAHDGYGSSYGGTAGPGAPGGRQAAADFRDGPGAPGDRDQDLPPF